MSVFNPYMRMIKLVDGNLQPKRFAPDRRVGVVKDRRLEPGPARNSGGREDAVLDRLSVSVDDHDRDLDVARRGLASAFEVSPFDGQVEVVSEEKIKIEYEMK